MFDVFDLTLWSLLNEVSTSAGVFPPSNIEWIPTEIPSNSRTYHYQARRKPRCYTHFHFDWIIVRSFTMCAGADYPSEIDLMRLKWVFRSFLRLGKRRTRLLRPFFQPPSIRLHVINQWLIKRMFGTTENYVGGEITPSIWFLLCTIKKKDRKHSLRQITFYIPMAQHFSSSFDGWEKPLNRGRLKTTNFRRRYW